MNNGSAPGGFSKLPNALVDCGAWAALSRKAQAVLIVLIRYADGTTRNCWPSIEVIAKQSGVYRVSEATGELVAAGLIKRWRRGRKTFYHLLPPPTAVVTDLPPHHADVRPPTTGRDARGRFASHPQNEYPLQPHHADATRPHHADIDIDQLTKTQEKDYRAPAGFVGPPAPEENQRVPVEVIHQWMREEAPWAKPSRPPGEAGTVLEEPTE